MPPLCDLLGESSSTVSIMDGSRSNALSSKLLSSSSSRGFRLSDFRLRNTEAAILCRLDLVVCLW